MLVLLYLFNLIVTSLRGVQQASELKKLQKKLGCASTSLGSLSEASTVFDADLLQEFIEELVGKHLPLAQDRRLIDIQTKLRCQDEIKLSGTVLAVPILTRGGTGFCLPRMQLPRTCRVILKFNANCLHRCNVQRPETHHATWRRRWPSITTPASASSAAEEGSGTAADVISNEVTSAYTSPLWMDRSPFGIPDVAGATCR